MIIQALRPNIRKTPEELPEQHLSLLVRPVQVGVTDPTGTSTPDATPTLSPSFQW